MNKRTFGVVVCIMVVCGLAAYGQTTTTTTTSTTSTTVQTDQESQTHFRIGPQFGYFRSRGADHGTWMVGGATRLKLSPTLGLEGSVNYREESFGNGTVKTKSWPVMATGLLYFFPALYGAIGAGWYNTRIDVNATTGPGGAVVRVSDQQQRFGWHFGGGLELPLDKEQRSAFVADIRYVFLNYNWDKLPGSEVNANYYVAMLGLQIGI